MFGQNICTFKIFDKKGLPGGPMARTPCSQWRGPAFRGSGLIPCWETKIPHTANDYNNKKIPHAAAAKTGAANKILKIFLNFLISISFKFPFRKFQVLLLNLNLLRSFIKMFIYPFQLWLVLLILCQEKIFNIPTFSLLSEPLFLYNWIAFYLIAVF